MGDPPQDSRVRVFTEGYREDLYPVRFRLVRQAAPEHLMLGGVPCGIVSVREQDDPEKPMITLRTVHLLLHQDPFGPLTNCAVHSRAPLGPKGIHLGREPFDDIDNPFWFTNPFYIVVKGKQADPVVGMEALEKLSRCLRCCFDLLPPSCCRRYPTLAAPSLCVWSA